MQSGGANELDIPVVPLIDMAFQLIFFFVITGAEQTVGFDETIKLAQAKYSKPITGRMPEGVVINIRKDGTFNIGNAMYTTSSLISTLREVKAAMPLMSVTLRCDKDVKYEFVDRVVEAVSDTKGAGITKVRLVAESKE